MKATSTSADNAKSETVGRRKRGRRKWIALLIVLALLAGLLLIPRLLTPGMGQQPTGTTSSDLRSATVETGSITTAVSGSGSLTSAEAKKVTVPEGVEIETVLVSAGDQVSEGDTLATVDQSSVLTALADVQEQLEDLDEQLEDLDEQLEDKEDDTVSSKIKAGISGRVKAVWAEKGDTVSAVMAEQGGLLLLSLDGQMKVTLSAADGVSAGDEVTVTFSDGTSVEGTVESAGSSGLVVTLTDNGPALGETVSVTAENGNDLGSGTLEVHSPLTVTGYTGVISSVKVEENDKVSASTVLFTLKELGHTAEYNALLVQRQELAEQLQTLSALYQNNTITAPFSGTIQTVEVDTESEDTSVSQTSGSNYAPVNADGSGVQGGVVLLSAVSPGVNSTPEDSDQAEETPATPEDSTEEPEETPETPEDPPEETPQEPAETPDDSEETPEQPDDDQQQETVPVQVTVTARVTLDGTADLTGKFSFSLSGEGATQEAVCDREGKVTFQPLVFQDPGSYVYRLYQNQGQDSQIQYDTTLYTLTVNVVRQEDGSLSASLLPANQEFLFANQSAQTGEQPSGENSGGLPTGGGSVSSGGTFGGSYSGTQAVSGVSSAVSTESNATASAELEEITVLTLSPNDTMTVSVSVDELDILSVQKGQEASVSVDALEDSSITGTVTGVDASGSSSGGVTKYTVEVTIEKTEQMLAGMNASVEIVISQTQDCLIIPEAALQQDGARTFVYTSMDEETGALGGKAEVETGVSDGTNVEILSGLSQGDTVYYQYVDAGSESGSFEDRMSMGGFGSGDFDGGGMPSGGGPGDGFSGGRD